MPSPDNSPPELVFNISNILLSLSKKEEELIWKNCAFSQPASAPRGLPCISKTGVWVGWYFDLAPETVHAQAPWGAAILQRADQSDLQTVPWLNFRRSSLVSTPAQGLSDSNSQLCIWARCSTPGIQCFLFLLTRCNFIQFQAISLKLKNGRLVKNALQEIILKTPVFMGC